MLGWNKGIFDGLRQKLKGWRTIIIGALAAAPLAILQILEQFQIIDPSTILPEPWGQRVALGIAIAMILLRLVTNTRVGQKDE